MVQQKKAILVMETCLIICILLLSAITSNAAKESILSDATDSNLKTGLTGEMPSPQEDKRLSPRREINVYRVTFNKNGGTEPSWKSMTVIQGQRYRMFPIVERKGYDLKGWYTAKSGGIRVTRNSKATTPRDHTLFAQWTKVTKPKKSRILSVKNRVPRQISITIKAQNGVDGYQITYAANKRFKNAKSVIAETNKKTIKRLKKGVTYYVKARAYRLYSDYKISWGCNGKTVKVKVRK